MYSLHILYYTYIRSLLSEAKDLGNCWSELIVLFQRSFINVFELFQAIFIISFILPQRLGAKQLVFSNNIFVKNRFMTTRHSKEQKICKNNQNPKFFYHHYLLKARKIIIIYFHKKYYDEKHFFSFDEFKALLFINSCFLGLVTRNTKIQIICIYKLNFNYSNTSIFPFLYWIFLLVLL